jgi:hypothetical protein
MRLTRLRSAVAGPAILVPTPSKPTKLAQIANTQTEGGTSPEAMNSALKKLAARLKVRVRPIQELDVRGILELIKDYNRAAKRTKAPEIPDPGSFIDMGRIYGEMDFQVLKEARTKSKSDLGRFQRTVQSHIDAGIPLLWSVYLMIKESGLPQSGVVTCVSSSATTTPSRKFFSRIPGEQDTS